MIEMLAYTCLKGVSHGDGQEIHTKNKWDFYLCAYPDLVPHRTGERP